MVTHHTAATRACELIRECDALRQERDDLQYELAWNEHTLAGLHTRLRAEQHDHTRTNARAVRLWGLLKQQTRQLRAVREQLHTTEKSLREATNEGGGR